MSVSRSELVERLASSADITARDASAVVGTVVRSISEALARGDRVELRAFGVFSTRERPEREARNPRTGEVVTVDAKRVVHFKAGKQLLQILKGDADALALLREKQQAQRRRRDEKHGQLNLF